MFLLFLVFEGSPDTLEVFKKPQMAAFSTPGFPVGLELAAGDYIGIKKAREKESRLQPGFSGISLQND